MILSMTFLKMFLQIFSTIFVEDVLKALLKECLEGVLFDILEVSWGEWEGWVFRNAP